MAFLWFLLSIGLAAIPTFALHAATSARWGRHPLSLAAASVAVAICPLAIPAEFRKARFFSAIAMAACLLKLTDAWADSCAGARPNLVEFIRFLFHPFTLVRRKLADEPQPPPATNVIRVAAGSLFFAAGIAAMIGLRQQDWTSIPWPIEHVAKVVAIYLIVLTLAAVLESAWRLGGGRGRDFMNHPLAARTPADFWRRYNRPVQQFFQVRLFLLAGGRRAPTQAMLVTFLISGMIHEYVFGIAAARVQGCQMAFFCIQGLAATATARFRPRGLAAVAAIAATLAFNLTTGVLFFASVNEVLPFYSRVPWEP